MRKTTPLSLPVTRKGQVKFILRSNGTLIFKLSLLNIIFALPFFAELFYLLFAIGPILNGDGTDTEKIALLCNLIRVTSLFTPITFAFLSTGISGISNVFKKLIYNDGYVLKRDFFKGIKEGKDGILANTILGAFVTIWLLGVFSLNGIGIDGVFLMFLIMTIVILLVIPILFLYNSLFSIYYSSGFFGLLKNAFIFSFHSFGVSFGLFLLGNMFFIVPYLIDLILFSRITYLSLSGLFLDFIYFGVFTHMLLQLYAVSRFDETINKGSYPDMYRKGLYREEGIDE